jgi:hypothetical protein
MRNPQRSVKSASVHLAQLAMAWGFAASCGTAAALPTTDADGDIDLTASATSTPSSVTLSTTALPTVILYTVTLTHYPNNELLNQMGFTATTSVRDNTNAVVSGQLATFQSTPTGCTLNGDSTQMTCSNLGSLTAANSTVSFTATVKAPTAGDHITLAITSVTYEDPDVVGAQTIASTATVNTGLTAPSPTNVSTYVPPAGGSFYTGTNGGLPFAAPLNTWTAGVTVPSSGGTTGQVNNVIGTSGCPQASNLFDCSSSTITVPGEFPNLLTFVLRRDASTIQGNGKIANAIVYYDNPSHPATGINYAGFGFQVPACTDTTYGALPQSGIPCITARNSYFKYKNGDVKTAKDGSTGNDDGQNSGKLLYWEFIILAVDNGRFSN